MVGLGRCSVGHVRKVDVELMLTRNLSMRRSNRLVSVLTCAAALALGGCGARDAAAPEDLGQGLTEPRTPSVDTTRPPAPPTDTSRPPVSPPLPPSLTPGTAYWSMTGSPPTPVPFNEAGWDVQLYSRDRDTWYTPEAMDAHHGQDCAGFPGIHRVTRYDQMVYRCRDHIMTAINAEGYGGVILTPDRLLDFAAGEAVIRFDMSTFRSSTRDWINVWISPYEAHLSVPAVEWAPGANGPPRDGVFIEHTAFGNLCPRFVRNYVVTELACNDGRSLSERIVFSATRRNTVEIRISASRVKVSMPNDSIVFSDVALPAALPFNQGVVQFGHYSYNPTKCESRCPPGGWAPNTWHWDEIYLAPSIPFTIIRADRRFVDGSGGTVTFSAPAPANAKMRFYAMGVSPDVSFDGGATWRVPVEQGSGKTTEPERQYWTPIPAGTTQVQFRPARLITWWNERNSWIARDFAVFAR